MTDTMPLVRRVRELERAIESVLGMSTMNDAERYANRVQSVLYDALHAPKPSTAPVVREKDWREENEGYYG